MVGAHDRPWGAQGCSAPRHGLLVPWGSRGADCLRKMRVPASQGSGLSPRPRGCRVPGRSSDLPISAGEEPPAWLGHFCSLLPTSGSSFEEPSPAFGPGDQTCVLTGFLLAFPSSGILSSELG